MSIRLPISRRALSTALALAAVVAGPAQANHRPGGAHLAAVGPVDPANGFPMWYLDSAGVRLELCLDFQNALCGFVGNEIPNPLDPVVFPTNFPDEAFWWAGGAIMDSNGGGSADLILGLEAAFAGGGVVDGDQVSFGRVRIRVDNLPLGTYTVTHPYGTDVFDVDTLGPGSINNTEDIGITVPGVFTGALQSSISPFLAQVGAPPGYLGDPNVPGPVTGSVFNTNFFRIEGPDGAFGAGNAFLCANPALGANPLSLTDCIETDQFTVMGRIARAAGVEATRVSYERAADGTGGVLDVFARTVPGQSIALSGAGLPNAALRGNAEGEYFARLRYTGAPPALVNLTNTTDDPVSTVTAAVTDRVNVLSATYDGDLRTLTIQADTSDLFLNPVLTAEGFGDLDAGGTIVIPAVDAPPSVVTVSSANGGLDTAEVVSVAGDFNPVAVIANAGLDQTVAAGATVTLNATGSSGSITSYTWTQTGGPVVSLTSVTQVQPAFVAPIPAPATTIILTFDLTVTGPGAPPSTDSVTIAVAPPAPPVANAGADRTNAIVGQLQTLSSAGTTNASSFAWVQTGGPAVALLNASSATASFNFPMPAFPANQATLTFQLTATGPGGSATDSVTIRNTIDTLTTTRAEFRTGTNQWRVDGTSTILGSPNGPGDNITVRLASTCVNPNLVIATRATNNLGVWAYTESGTPAARRPGTCRRLDIVSDRGGVLTQVVLTVRN